uniref:Uncharacterized protein n=1 Tax=Panagrolaimus superbus TaxID=310955 RepID=A0A914YPV1_9BILA
MIKVQKKLLPKNELIHNTALKFSFNRSSYDVIKEVEKNRNKLQNDRFAEMLIKTMKDCVDSAYILASFRKQIRENANFEKILENQDIMKQNLNLLVRNMHLNHQPFFFQNADVNWEATFEKVIKNLRFQKRQAVFKTLKETVGYGITSDGIEYFFTLPLNNQTQCYSNKECSVGSKLRTKACGNFRIPEKCGNSFQYILLIEKSGRLSKLSKLMPNGGITSIQN